MRVRYQADKARHCLFPCRHFALDNCNVGSPLLTGLPARMENPFVRRDGAKPVAAVSALGDRGGRHGLDAGTLLTGIGAREKFLTFSPKVLTAPRSNFSRVISRTMASMP